MDDGYIEPDMRVAGPLLARLPPGPVVMLNLLRFAETADYAAHPLLEPDAPIRGEDAYRRYMAHTQPFLAAVGGEVLFFGAASGFVIGPADDGWDLVLLVRYPSKEAFIEMATNRDYLAGTGHRSASLVDSRLLPMIPSTPEP